jgi:ParB-like nuclease domain
MTDPSPKRVERDARLRWVPITETKSSPMAQRDLKQSRIDALAANFDLEQLGTPTVNHRDGFWYIIDGQHRIAALKEIGYGDQQVQCWAYEGLTEKEEAEKFLKLNDYLAVNAFAKFRIGVRAERTEETDIDRIVQAQGLHISQNKGEGAISAVATLRKVYRRSPATLARTLRLVRDSYGDAGLEGPVIEGVGLLCHRYNGDLDDERTVKALSTALGGVNGLLGKAEVLRKQTHQARSHCVAAAAVELINQGRGGKKLPSWWKADS